ncbi:MAG: FecR domain-containing protein [Gammaproteobacteria bacterium]|nr:FecR domain-containing protein [Gammaproteobacteria bacterium]
MSLTLTAPAAGARDPVGQVARLEGDALVTRAGAETTDLLEPEAPVYLQDRIETLAGSRIELRFEDDTVVFLGAKSTLRITEFVLSAGGERDSAVLDLITGIFRAIVTRVLPDAAFEVRTQRVVAAVRGTDWMGEVSDDTFSVVVLDGAVAVQRADEEVVLRTGDGVDVRSGEPLRKKRWGQGRIDGMRERMFHRMESRGMGMDPSRMRGPRSSRMRSERPGSP